MTKRYDVTALGEVLIDFTENGSSAQGNPVYEANPGGAPCNVLAMLQKLGHKTAFLGKVGEDIFGRRLEKVLKETGIDTAGLGTTELEEMLRFANAAASIVTTRRGALRVMPEPEEIQALLAEKSI